MTVKQKLFLKEFRDLLLKYNVKIGWNCHCYSFIYMSGQKDIELFNNYIDYNNLNDLYKKAVKDINKRLKNNKINKESEGKIKC